MPFEPFSDSRLLDQVIAIARDAGAAIMRFYKQLDAAVRVKSDASPFTAADEAADALITDALRHLTPTIPIVSEESVELHTLVAPANEFWLVDPLDGTREFIGGRDEFTVNIALVRNGAPVLGVVFLPARNELYAGAVGQGAMLINGLGKRRIHCRPLPAAGATVAISRSHGDRVADRALLGRIVATAEVQAGSALKFCLVARGDADAYPRSGRTMEWDTAAGQAVLTAAGGSVIDRNGFPLAYGKPGFENPGFLALAKPSESSG